MKRCLSYLGVFIFLFSILVSCSDDGASFWDAIVTVRVEDTQGELKAGKNVYLYLNEEITASTNPDGAFSMVTTNENGEAVFDLNLANLNVPSYLSVNLNFGVFYVEANEIQIAGTTSVTVEAGEAKEVLLTVLF